MRYLLLRKALKSTATCHVLRISTKCISIYCIHLVNILGGGGGYYGLVIAMAHLLMFLVFGGYLKTFLLIDSTSQSQIFDITHL